MQLRKRLLEKLGVAAHRKAAWTADRLEAFDQIVLRLHTIECVTGKPPQQGGCHLLVIPEQRR